MYKTFVFNRVDDSKVKLKMAKTKYTLEEPKNVAERIKKGTDTKKNNDPNSDLDFIYSFKFSITEKGFITEQSFGVWTATLCHSWNYQL